jgi:hypothetical protein
MPCVPGLDRNLRRKGAAGRGRGRLFADREAAVECNDKRSRERLVGNTVPTGG